MSLNHKELIIPLWHPNKHIIGIFNSVFYYCIFQNPLAHKRSRVNTVKEFYRVIIIHLITHTILPAITTYMYREDPIPIKLYASIFRGMYTLCTQIWY